MNFRKYFAEIFGTAVLVFVACGTVIFTSGNLVAVGLAFGLSVVAMAYAIGHISGAHLNPAVSLGALVANRISFKDFVGYVIAQIIGAIIGGALIFGGLKLLNDPMHNVTDIMGNAATGYANAAIGTANQIILGLAVEIVLTFIFVFVILAVTRKDADSKIAGLIIGLTLTIIIMLGAMLTGPSVNPARSIGINIFAGTEMLKQLWVSVVGPLVGAVLAAFTAKCLLNTVSETETKQVKKQTK